MTDRGRVGAKMGLDATKALVCGSLDPARPGDG
jgi:hypothetical protein